MFLNFFLSFDCLTLTFFLILLNVKKTFFTWDDHVVVDVEANIIPFLTNFRFIHVSRCFVTMFINIHYNLKIKN